MARISGCFYKNPQQSDMIEGKIFSMLKSMDSEGKRKFDYYSDHSNIAFGVSGATDALYEEDNYVICFNGHLNNSEEIQSKNGEKNQTAGRAILNLFKEEGEDVASLLEGIYSCIILDKKKNLLWIITDRGGYEFVYYYMDDCTFIFSNEIRPILKVLDTPPDIDLDGICNIYIFNTIFNTATPFKSIKLLPHAALISVSKDKTSVKQYWNYPIDIELYKKNDCELLQDSRQFIQKAVQKASYGYDNVGVMLTGGLDSRLLASVAAQNEKINIAYNFDFGEGKSKEESLAESIANKLDIKFCRMASTSAYTLEEMEKCILDTDGQWAFVDLLPYIKEISEENPGIALINGFLMDTLFKSSWSYFPGKIPDDLESALGRRYSAVGDYLLDKLFDREFAKNIKDARSRSIQETIGGIRRENAPEASLKFYCINRARRNHNLVFKTFKKYVDVILPGADYRLMDFAFRLPYKLRADPDFYVTLICQWFPDIAAIPWDRTGRTLTQSLPFKNFKRNLNLFKLKYYIQRLTRGKIDFLNSVSGFNWRLRNDKKFRESMKEILFDHKTLSRGFFNRKAMELIFSEHLMGKDYAPIFKAVISVEMFFNKFVDQNTRAY